jgi:hypothetical protein
MSQMFGRAPSGASIGSRASTRLSVERTRKRLEIEALRALSKTGMGARFHFSATQQNYREQVKKSEHLLSRSLSNVAGLAVVTLLLGVAINELCAAPDYTEEELSTAQKALLADAADNKVSPVAYMQTIPSEVLHAVLA